MRLVTTACLLAATMTAPAFAADMPASAPAATQAAKGVSQSSAISRIAAKGFTRMTPLKQEADGSWHGTAYLSDSPYEVTVAPDGKVTSKSSS